MITQIEINGLTLGTVASGYHFVRLSGFGFPKVDVNVKERGSYHGANLNSYRYSRREMGIEFEIIGTDKTDYEAKRIALEKALDLSMGLTTVTITTKSGLVVEAEAIINSDLDDEYERGKIIISNARLNLVAPYPFLLEETVNSVQVDAFDGGGFSIPFAIPFDMGVGGSGIEVINNGGNARAFPTIKIYGIIENPTISNETTGEAININYTLSTVADYIVLDTYNRTALLNGATNVKKYVTPTAQQWLTLQNGNNSLKLSGASIGSGAKAIVEFQDTYLGI